MKDGGMRGEEDEGEEDGGRRMGTSGARRIGA